MKRRSVLCVAVLLFSLLFAGAVTAADQDHDGLDDDWEAAHEGYDNTTKDNWQDLDNDGIVDGEEENATKALKNEVIEENHHYWSAFAATAIIAFAIFCLLAGIFTAYFGAGKSRIIGVVLTIVGAVGLLGFFFIKLIQKTDTIVGLVHWDKFFVVYSFLIVLGAIIGAVVAVGVFLLAIMKA